MCDKVVDSYLFSLKFVPDWFVMSKMTDKLENVIFFNDEALLIYIAILLHSLATI